MGGRTLLVSGRRVLDQKSNGQNSPQDKATMGKPTTRLIHLWTAAIQSGHHDAIYLVGGLGGLVWWRRGGRGRLGGWVAVALLSWHRVFALYEVG